MVKNSRYPASGPVAVIAGIRALDMGSMFPCGNVAVVTGKAGTQYISVIDSNSGYPAGIPVAIFTQIIGINVVIVFAGRNGSVVATGTIGSIGRVVKGGRYPARSPVTVIAGIRALDMGSMFPCGNVAVVTGKAGTQYISVIDSNSGYPAGIPVAIFTQIIGINVVIVFAGRNGSVVATGTIGSIGRVVKGGRYPARSPVTVIAGIRALDMGSMFPFGNAAVMAGEAGAYNIGMIDSLEG